MLHNEIWISLSRYWTGKFKNSIDVKGLEFDQVDRERNWDDQILLNGILFYLGSGIKAFGTSHLPLCQIDGILTTVLIHAGPVEFLYYWFHRALHHDYLYSRYHSHHHSSIVTEPITAVIHPFAEHIIYFMLFAIPMVATLLAGTASVVSITGYLTYVDFMNNLGHCNYELIPKWVISLFPPLKYLTYTPSFHSLHHTQFRTNYSLFMPLYDYIYGTMDKSTDELYETSLKREAESLDVLHLTHLTTPESIYHLRLGFTPLASRPLTSKWYLWLIWPATLWSMMVTWLYGRTFVVERHRYSKLRLQTWAIPKYSIQYFLQSQKKSISSLIEDAILDAEERGAKVLSLGLLNRQGEELNRYGEVYVERNPKLNVKIVDGSSLAVAVVLNSIPKGTNQVVLRGKLTKVAYALAFTLCQRGVEVVTLHEHEYLKLKKWLNNESESNLVLSRDYAQKNWLPRRVMSAWRIAAIVHALEGWKEHECGLYTMSDVEKVWQASLGHGFQPLVFPTQF
ncbi:Protein ECERIFERUM 1 [Morella rubra]|uniref:Protein ECERIFERUM 1 n=1 Tax=Morella rubra TaxID=262757 RepID=A0A6A1WCR6_9ROSI|nr:Protein ECERIFERUM 1 [Morella rubra]